MDVVSTDGQARTTLAWTLGLFTLALAVRIVGSHATVLQTDEFFHLLVGHSLAEDRGFALIEGRYDRGAAYSAAVAGLYTLGGDGVALARLPALLGGALCVPLLFLLVNHMVGRAPAIIAALLLAGDALAVETSQFARFYSWQAAAVLGMVLLGQGAAHRRWPAGRRVGAAALALLALHLQVTSIAFVAALGAFVGGEWLLRPEVRAWFAAPSRRWLLPAGGALLLAFGVAAFVIMWPALRSVDGWAEGNKDHAGYYLNALSLSYGAVWPWTGAAALVVLRRHPRAACLFGLLFASAIVLQSAGGMKAPRYLMPALPFLFALWATAAVWLAGVLRFAIMGMAERFGRPVWGSTAALILSVAVVVAPMLANRDQWSGWRASALALTAVIREPGLLMAEPDDPPWRAARADLTRLVEEGGVVATSDVLRAEHYGLRPGVSLRGRDGRALFSRDPRTGLPAARTGPEVAQLIRCTSAGVFIVPAEHWRTFVVTDGQADAIERLTTPTRVISGFHTSRWRHPSPAEPACTTVAQLARR